MEFDHYAPGPFNDDRQNIHFLSYTVFHKKLHHIQTFYVQYEWHTWKRYPFTASSCKGTASSFRFHIPELLTLLPIALSTTLKSNVNDAEEKSPLHEI